MAYLPVIYLDVHIPDPPKLGRMLHASWRARVAKERADSSRSIRTKEPIPTLQGDAVERVKRKYVCRRVVR